MSILWFWRIWALGCLVAMMALVPSVHSQVAFFGLGIALVALIANFIEEHT